MSQSDLRAKYGPNAFDVGRKIQGRNFENRVAQRDSLDPHFTRAWVDFAINGMSARKALDTRTRLLVLTGQYTMAKSHEMLEDTIRAAVDAGVDTREILEIVLQCVVCVRSTPRPVSHELLTGVPPEARTQLDRRSAVENPPPGSVTCQVTSEGL
jgi:alkylhydroperoxidase/carboxymuconolactone decarboxylase family protein YurZ